MTLKVLSSGLKAPTETPEQTPTAEGSWDLGAGAGQVGQ